MTHKNNKFINSPSNTTSWDLSIVSLITFINHLPVHDLPKFGKMGGTTVLIIEIIGVLPNVEGQKGLQALGNGVGSAGFLRDDQGAISLSGEPYPAAAKKAYAFGNELFFESVETPPLLHDLIDHLACRSCRFRSKLREIEVVVEDLTGIVEHATSGLLHNLLQRKVLESRTCNEFVEVVDIALEVLAVVEFECLGTDDGCQCVFSVWKFD